MTTTSRCIALSVVLAFCAGGARAESVDLSKPSPRIPARTPETLPAGGASRIIEFTLWRNTIDAHDVVGKFQDGLLCAEGADVFYTKRFDEFLIRNVTKVFKEESIRFGFSLPEGTKSVFEDKAPNGADFRLGATLLKFDYRVCGRHDTKGDVYAAIKWELFSARRQKVVYSATIESSFNADKSMPFSQFEKALARSMVHNLLGDPRFAQVVQSGGNADAEPAQALVPLQIPQGQAVGGGVSKAASNLLAAVVTVESGVGSGTAFYISQDGYLLTNQHVVADAKFVRIKLPGGRSLVGEVLRTDRQRDVALIRTDPVATGVLTLRREEARIGEEVYALGSPFGDLLSGTLTRGVLSAKRVFEGVAYLQSDVAVNPGNSGGPLIDASGQVLGITRLASTAQGINLFIPVDDVLDKLALTIVAGKPAVQTK